MYYLLRSLMVPPGINLLILLFGIVLWRWRKLSLTLIIVALLSLYFLSTPFIAAQLANTLQAQKINHHYLNLPHDSTAIVILGSGRINNSPEYGGDTVSAQSLQRLHYGAHIYRATHFPILTSGGHLLPTQQATAQLMATVLHRDFQIPVKWQEKNSIDTAQNAKFSAKILRQHHIKNIILVDQAIHMKRSANAFRQQGFTVFPAPTAYITPPPSNSAFALWQPSALALHSSSLVIHEYWGLLKQHLSSVESADSH